MTSEILAAKSFGLELVHQLFPDSHRQIFSGHDLPVSLWSKVDFSPRSESGADYEVLTPVGSHGASLDSTGLVVSVPEWARDAFASAVQEGVDPAQVNKFLTSSLLDEVRQARGAPSFRPWVASGELKVAGSGDVELSIRRPEDGQTIVEFSDLGIEWRCEGDSVGADKPLPGMPITVAHRLCGGLAPYGPSTLPDRDAGDFELIGTVEKGKDVYFSLRSVDEAGIARITYINASTFQVAFEELAEPYALQDARVVYGDYRDERGYGFPFSIQVEAGSGSGELKMDVLIDKLVVQ